MFVNNVYLILDIGWTGAGRWGPAQCAVMMLLCRRAVARIMRIVQFLLFDIDITLIYTIFDAGALPTRTFTVSDFPNLSMKIFDLCG